MSTAVADPPVTTIARSDLAGALKLAASIKAKTLTLTFGEALAVSADAFGVAAVTTIPGEGEAAEITVSRVTLAGILACCDSSLRLSVVQGALEIASGPATCRLPVEKPWPSPSPAVDPDLGMDTPTDAVTMEAPVLVEALRRALPFASTDQTRPILCTIAFSPGRRSMVATDSYRLAVIRYGDDDGPADEVPWLIQRDAATSLVRLLAKKLGQVDLWQTETHVHARFEDTHWSMVRETGQFPSYEELLPDKYEANVKVDRVDLLAGARSALSVCQRNEPLRLVVGEHCGINAGQQDRSGTVARRLATAACEGDEFEIGLNPSFLADIAAAAPVERLTLRLISPLRPMMVEAARDLYLLMPIRLNA